MEKTSKVKTVHSSKEWKGEKGSVWYNNVTLENGDEINIGKKSALKEGDEVTYEITASDDDGQRFKKAKSVTPQKQFGARQVNEKSIIAQVALKCASQALQQSMSSQDPQKVLLYAEQFNKWLLEKSGL